MNLSLPHSKTDIINEKYDFSNHSQLPGAPKLPNAPDSPGGPSLHGPNPVPSYQPIEMQNEPILQSANHRSLLENVSRYWNEMTANPITIENIQQQFGEIGSKIGNFFQAVKSSGFNCFNSNPSPSSTSPPPHRQGQPSSDSNNGSFFTDKLKSIFNRVSVLLKKYVVVLN